MPVFRNAFIEKLRKFTQSVFIEKVWKLTIRFMVISACPSREAHAQSQRICRICSKLTKETPEQRWRLTSFWYHYCELWTYFTPFFSVVDLEQVNACWVYANMGKMKKRENSIFWPQILSVWSNFLSFCLLIFTRKWFFHVILESNSWNKLRMHNLMMQRIFSCCSFV